MAICREMNHDVFREWVAGLPEATRSLAEKFPPDRLYKLSPHGERCTIESYSDTGTVTVAITGQYNRVLFSKSVFGVPPEDLEECDLPDPDEELGDMAAEAGYTEDDIREILIPKIREQMRKDGKL